MDFNNKGLNANPSQEEVFDAEQAAGLKMILQQLMGLRHMTPLINLEMAHQGKILLAIFKFLP